MALPWFRADTNFPTHDKILDLVGHGQKGKAAGFAYFSALGNQVGSGGKGEIKKAHLPFVHATPADARLLVEVGLWEVIDGGWRIKNFGTRQVVGMSEQVRAEEVSHARAEAGKKGADSRWSQ